MIPFLNALELLQSRTKPLIYYLNSWLLFVNIPVFLVAANHYSDVTWTLLHRKSLASWLFCQQLVHANNKESIKVPLYWPFLRGIHLWPMMWTVFFMSWFHQIALKWYMNWDLWATFEMTFQYFFIFQWLLKHSDDRCISHFLHRNLIYFCRPKTADWI